MLDVHMRACYTINALQILLAETYFEIVQQKPAACDAVAKKMSFISNGIPWGDKVRSAAEHALPQWFVQRCSQA